MGIFLFVALILSILIFWPSPVYYEGPKSDHFNGKTFFNAEHRVLNFSQVFEWMLTRKPEPWPDYVEIKQSIPPKHSDILRITFINHSTFLIQWAGINILTDPMYSERASPFSFIGPKRHHDPGIAFENLPPIDYVLISHNHYDHMDLATLKALEEKFHPVFLTGLGNDAYLKGRGIDPVIGLDWWEDYRGFTYVPSEHFSSRWWKDRNRMLWGGFLIHHGGEYLYFAGDTAFGSHFNTISSKYGPPKVSFLPIGAYEPRWFMETNHMDPIDALEAHRLLGSKTSIGMHFGTFQMADESREGPQQILQRERTTERFFTIEPGQSVDLHDLEK